VTSSIVEGADTLDSYTFDSSGFGAACVAPNWIRFIESSQVDSGGGVNIDVDGEYPEDARPVAVIDLSAAVSHHLGRQISQNQTFRVKYISVTLENKDDTIDNSESAMFSGRIRWYSPTHHRVEAYRLYRESWKAYYTASTNTLAFDDEHTATGGGTYKGLRLGLCETAAYEQVPYQATDPFTDVEGAWPNLNLIFNAYDNMLPSGDVDKKPDNALWTSGRTGYPNGIDWQASMKNMGSQQVAADSNQFQIDCDADVMCGLMCLDIQGSSAQGDIADSLFTDEYRIRVTIGVDGWGGDF